MMIIIWHNPRCAKSRQTLQLLQEEGVDPDIVNYLTARISPKQLTDVLHKLGLPARQLLRTEEADYKALNLANPALSDTDLIKIMCKHPQLIQRPIVINGDRAVLGRPPETVLDIL